MKKKKRQRIPESGRSPTPIVFKNIGRRGQRLCQKEKSRRACSLLHHHETINLVRLLYFRARKDESVALSSRSRQIRRLRGLQKRRPNPNRAWLICARP